MGHLIVHSLTQAYWGWCPTINLTAPTNTTVTWFYNKLHNKHITCIYCLTLYDLQNNYIKQLSTYKIL